jgi:pre-mRNA-processing factor 17
MTIFIFVTGAVDSLQHIDSLTDDMMHNPKHEELFAPGIGPDNPFQTRQQHAHKNILSRVCGN